MYVESSVKAPEITVTPTTPVQPSTPAKPAKPAKPAENKGTTTTTTTCRWPPTPLPQRQKQPLQRSWTKTATTGLCCGGRRPKARSLS